MMYITCQLLWYKAMTVLVSCHCSLFYFCSLKWFYMYKNASNTDLFGGHIGMLFGLRKSSSMSKTPCMLVDWALAAHRCKI